MGVDTTIYIGKGKALPKENRLSDLIPDFDDDRYDAVWKFMAEEYPLLSLFEVGNSMSGDVQWMLSVDSSLESYEVYELPGGVLDAVGQPTSEEEKKFNEAYARFTGQLVLLESFVAVHWY